MAKNTSLFGKVSGKIGAVVFSTSGGEIISREYNPHVSNPNTSAQVDQRAKMKLMSQLSAALAPVLAMTKDGLVSRRNKFTKYNFRYAYALDGTAQVSYENLQLTEGQLALPMIGGAIYDGKETVFLVKSPSENIARVVWCVYRKTDEGKLEFVKSAIVSEKGTTAGKYFPYETNIATQDSHPTYGTYVYYAYGMVDTSEQAAAQYGNLNVQNATDLATLVATRAIDFTNYQFTQTRGATWNAGATTPQYTGTDIQPGQIRVFATALGQGGSVTGGGVYDEGAQVTLQATANEGYQFVNWKINGTSQVVSSANPYVFNAEEDVDLIATFNAVGGGGGL